MTRINIAGIYYPTPSQLLTPLPILTTRLRTEIVDLTATHTLTQIFCNPITVSSTTTGDLSIPEATYTFPLYESCAVTSFTAQVGANLIHGVVKPKAEAKADYEAVKAEGRQAALLEQNTAEVFTTSVGNIPPGAFVVVCIKYVHELKQDIEVEGVRLVVPTVIAPKYGWTSPDSGLYKPGWGNNWNAMRPELEEICGGRPQTHGTSIEVLATMNGAIRSIQSPSHPISVDIGTHSPSASSTDFTPTKARATLALSSDSLVSLTSDLTLIISSVDLSTPRAFIAPHPTAPSATLMATLVPRFTLPPQHPDITFIIDRSGSMRDKISTVRTALHLFLASLPLGISFDIVSFGSTHSLLWPTPQPYSAAALEAAQACVDTMSANMGGTQILEPIQAAVDMRRPGRSLEVLILTDGEIWDTEKLFTYINGVAAGGDVRFFSLGVGKTVSHVLVDGIARAGKGYSQLVGEGENMKRKVMRMLKAALTPHVNDWAVTWEGKVEESGRAESAPAVNAPMSLFDPAANPDDTPEVALPPVVLPPVLQAPATIPPLFPYTRTTVYFHLTTTPHPTSITLTGTAQDTTTNTLQPLTITLPLTPVTSPTTSLGLHHLAGRKLLQDLEESRSTLLPPSPSAAQIAHLGAHLGTTFNLASKWTSFIAVSDSTDSPISTTLPQSPPHLSRKKVGMQAFRDSPPTARGFHPMLSRRGGSAVESLALSTASRKASVFMHSPAPASATESDDESVADGDIWYAAPQKVMAKKRKARGVSHSDRSEEVVVMGSDVLERLSKLQLFSGEFIMSVELLEILGVQKGVDEVVASEVGARASMFATVLVLVYLVEKMKDAEEEWELMAEKAKRWLEGETDEGGRAKLNEKAQMLICSI